MLKNKTQEFKQRYASSVSTKQTHRDKTPEYINNKFTKTGFTDVTTQNSIKISRSRKVAKVQSTAFFKSRFTFQPLTEPKKVNIMQFAQNQTSMCKYFEQGKTKIENKALKSQKINKQPSETVLIKKCNILIKQLPNIDDFFMSLTPRSLFFCCKCFRYVFAIQKNLHYPKCQNQVNLMQLTLIERQKIGWQKLNMIMQLSEYTKHKHERIESLFKQVKNGQVTVFDEIVISDNVTYLRFEQMLEAFIYTYEMLIKDGGYEKRSSIFSFKKIFSCVELKPESSGVYEKKFFG